MIFKVVERYEDPYEGENDVDEDGDVIPILNEEEENH